MIHFCMGFSIFLNDIGLLCVVWTLVSFFFNFYLFIFGCAGLSFMLGLFSSCSERGLLSSCGAQAPGHVGFSSSSSLTPEHRLSSCGPRA